MSNYYIQAKDKRTGNIHTIEALDDYYGKHKYGYKSQQDSWVYTESEFEEFFEVIMQRENKWQDIENLLSKELDVLENAISDENRTLVICSREEIWKLIYRLIDRAVAEERKAFGGCTKCYGKGYATVKDFTTTHADFIGDKTFSSENSPIRPCSCDRGKQIKEIINKDK